MTDLSKHITSIDLDGPKSALNITPVADGPVNIRPIEAVAPPPLPAPEDKGLNIALLCVTALGSLTAVALILAAIAASDGVMKPVIWLILVGSALMPWLFAYGLSGIRKSKSDVFRDAEDKAARTDERLDTILTRLETTSDSVLVLQGSVEEVGEAMLSTLKNAADFNAKTLDLSGSREVLLSTLSSRVEALDVAIDRLRTVEQAITTLSRNSESANHSAIADLSRQVAESQSLFAEQRVQAETGRANLVRAVEQITRIQADTLEMASAPGPELPDFSPTDLTETTSASQNSRESWAWSDMLSRVPDDSIIGQLSRIGLTPHVIIDEGLAGEAIAIAETSGRQGVVDLMQHRLSDPVHHLRDAITKDEGLRDMVKSHANTMMQSRDLDTPEGRAWMICVGALSDDP